MQAQCECPACNCGGRSNCRLAYLYTHNEKYRNYYDEKMKIRLRGSGYRPAEKVAPVAIPPAPKAEERRAGCGQCIHLRADSGERVECLTCKGNVKVKLFHCEVFSRCTLEKRVDHFACCRDCKRYEPREGEMRPILWAYGVTTVPERQDNLLPRTLESLRGAGFETPRLFVDGDDIKNNYGLDVTVRIPRIRTHGNWILSLYELYLREPAADRYAVFQDDFVTYRNLRKYLEACDYPEKGYWNLYTFPSNQKAASNVGLTARQKIGWYEALTMTGPVYNDGKAAQFGKGAVAIVFDRPTAIALLSSRAMVERAQDPIRGHKKVDGGIVTAMNQQGIREYVHNPSLVQHTGVRSTMGNMPHPLAPSFRGEEFDAMELLSEIRADQI